MTIAQWPTGERPRERLSAQGPGALSDAELLAVVLRTGVKGKNAVTLGRELISLFGGIAGVLAARPNELQAIPGIGPAKLAQLQAALELSRRVLHAQIAREDALASPAGVRDFLRLTIGGKEYEVFVAVFLDAQHRVIEVEELFRGTLTHTSVYPREVVKAALSRNAAAVIFAHNHPSGVAEPSHADRALTDVLRRALDLVGIRVIDHFIVAGATGVSFAERGLL